MEYILSVFHVKKKSVSLKHNGTTVYWQQWQESCGNEEEILSLFLGPQPFSFPFPFPFPNPNDYTTTHVEKHDVNALTVHVLVMRWLYSK